jgi:hypothetical protein
MDNTDKTDKAIASLLLAVRTMKDNWLAHVEITKMQMKMAKLKYDAAIEAGFDNGVALFIAFKKDE